MPAGRPKHLTLSRLLLEHPNLQKEIARCIADGISKRAGNPHKYGSFNELRSFGSALLEILTEVAQDAAEGFKTDHGLTLNNSWKLTAIADATTKLYPHARDALGIPALAPSKEYAPKAMKPDWRRQLVDVQGQSQPARTTGPVVEEPDGPVQDGREKGASTQ